ncbi:MAG: Gfo/Idh/MocA family oxidoreductase [Verrucomicrobia bacterium]|nr:Gfo/Idh/MocA family oxidoreductase [Verrucomicrobiota bacterium]MBI3871440.1 Gfo/Idh/MocA family oxidoreductase [Verrucomicrobiota bacterium]
MKSLNRRSFLKRSALTGAAVAWSARSWSQVASANEDVRVGVIGFGGRGKDHLGGLSKLPGVRITALCDVDEAVMRAEAEKRPGAETHKDLRRLLDSKNVDVVTVATPNHWHSLAAIWAIQAGKDVYLEKPVSHNVWEGRQVVEAARKHKKIVQTGTQSRSSEAIREAVAWVQQGHFGKILVARGLCYKPRRSIGKVDGPQPIPPGVDYDLWCGPALKLPLMRQKLHYDWHWDFNTGNGDLGNQGIHQMDIARWFLGESELSPRVMSVGGRLGYIDDGNTPNTQIVWHGYAKAPLIFEVRGLPKGKQYQTDKDWNGNMDRFRGGSVAVLIHCEGGTVLVPNYSSATAIDTEGKEVKKWSGAEDHYGNFLKAVRSRKTSDLNADILEGHLSSALCHTGNISYRLGKHASPEEISESIASDKDLVETYGRMTEHLAANGVFIAKDRLGVGPMLKMNPKTERFTGNSAANNLLTRPYRKPYVVPTRV